MSEVNASSLQETYRLTSRGDILDKLRLLERRRALLLALPSQAQSGLAVTLVRVLPERNLLGVETGAERGMVERLLKAEQVSFDGTSHGVQFHFLASGIREATLNGRDVLAFPIPDSLYWLQRRHYFRVFIPSSNPIRCWITLPDGLVHSFDVVNLSVRGIALLDKSGLLRFWGRPGQVFESCRLDLQGFENDRFDLVIRGKLETSAPGERVPTMRVGFELRGISPALEAKLQRLVHDIEVRARKERQHLESYGP